MVQNRLRGRASQRIRVHYNVYEYLCDQRALRSSTDQCPSYSLVLRREERRVSYVQERKNVMGD